MSHRKWTVALLMIIVVTLVTAGFPTKSYSQTIAEGKYSVAGLDNEREVETFFINFREAVKKHDKEKISSMISYPAKVTLASGKIVTIKAPKNFIKTYDKIFDSMFTDVISKKLPKDLWADSNGVSTESGEIWFGGVIEGKNNKYELKIITINGVTARH